MEIRISDGLLSFDSVSVRYDKRYLSPADVVEMLTEWIPRLMNEVSCRQPIYLPFSIDDEFLEAFEVEDHGEQVSLRAVKLDGMGYVPEVDPLLDELKKEHRPVLERRAQELLTCDKKQLLDAVKQAIARNG